MSPPNKLEVESQLIDFGLHVVGQTISRTITLTNKGALATHFSLDTSEGLSAESSQVQMSSQHLPAEIQVSHSFWVIWGFWHLLMKYVGSFTNRTNLICVLLTDRMKAAMV